MRAHLFLVLTLVVGCHGQKHDGVDAAPSASASGASPVAVPSASAATAPSATAKAPPPPGLPIPALDSSPAKAIDGAELKKLFDADKSRVVGKKFKMSGEMNSISYNAMTFGPDKGLHGPVDEGVENGVYSLTLRTKDKNHLASCYVDRAEQQVQVSDFKNGGTMIVDVEGVVEPTFGDLAPCKVTGKRKVKK
jgi:hypothetical protein